MSGKTDFTQMGSLRHALAQAEAEALCAVQANHDAARMNEEPEDWSASLWTTLRLTTINANRYRAALEQIDRTPSGLGAATIMRDITARALRPSD